MSVRKSEAGLGRQGGDREIKKSIADVLPDVNGFLRVWLGSERLAGGSPKKALALYGEVGKRK
jgi:hypothetical protein